MSDCYRKDHEQGPWFEIFCLKRIIAKLMIAGRDASFEKSLLRVWEKFPEYKNPYIPPEILAGLNTLEKRAGLPLTVSGNSKVLAALGKDAIPPSDFDVLRPKRIMKHQKRGRPRKESRISRTTAWRRKKEKEGQGELFTKNEKE